jgi:nitrite reductase/ring-hydroxylating ferredoxin subunit
MKLSKLYFFLIVFGLFIMFSTCKKKEDVVPYVYVNFSIFLSDPDYATLQTIGNHVIVTGGVCGIVIYRNSQTEFTAYDRCCSYKPSERCAVLPDTTNSLMLKCPCCGSKFSFLDGSVLSGSAARFLSSYTTSFDQNNIVHITN